MGIAVNTNWIPSHVGIIENELADVLAGEAAKTAANDVKLNRVVPQKSLSMASAKKMLKMATKSIMTKRWQDYNLIERQNLGKEPRPLWNNDGLNVREFNFNKPTGFIAKALTCKSYL